MREGWKKCKFKDAFDLQMGKTPSRDNLDFWGTDNTWVSISDMTEKFISSSKEGLTDLAVSSSGIKKVKEGTVIMSFKLSVGKVGIAAKDLYTNEAIMAFNTLPEKQEDILPLYTYYYLKGHKWEGSNKAVMGLTLNKASISSNTFAYPPLSTQHQIVAELDLLSHILDQKRQQLKEYDALAESIFYDMFGDPNNNEKAWATRDFSSCCENCDSQRKPITAKDRIQGTIPYYGASGIVDYVKDYIFDGSYLLISEDGANLLMRSTPIAFQIKGKNWVNNHAHVVKFLHIEEQIFMEYFFNLLDLKDLITGCAQPKLTQGALNKIPVFDIPLSLQQSFASKIEAIEKQKQMLKESIKETETLFQSRMDYWFNA